jgi:succinoglycan biosynthesis transport protein ExoP
MNSPSRLEFDSTTGAGAELRAIIAILRERWWVIVIVVAVVAGAAYARASTERSEYQAFALLTYDPTQSGLDLVGGSVTGLSSTPDAATIATDLAALAKLGTTNSVRVLAQKHAGPITTPVSVSADLNSDVVTVSATALSPKRAARVANAWAQALVAQDLAANRRGIALNIAEVRSQLPGAPDKQPLNAELSALRVLYSTQQSDLQLKQRATPPTARTSPKPLRDAGIGAVAGLLLAILLLAVIEALDRRLRSLSDVARFVPARTLAALPPTGPRKLGHGMMDGTTLEAFQQVQASLAFVTRDEDVRTIVVTSAVAKEGKSTLALGLAVTLGGSGRRVLLIDGDFRRPTVSEVLALDAGESSLSLLQHSDQAPTPQRFDLRFTRNDKKPTPALELGNGAHVLRSFYVLGAGRLGTTALNFFSDERFASYLATTRNYYDYVIIDSAPLLPVSDSAPLAALADAVILAVRLKYSRRDTVGHAAQLIARANGRLLGTVVATPVRELKQGYGYGYGYSARGGGTGRYVIVPSVETTAPD